MAGMNWVAEAPVPITATRLPASGSAWFQRDEWKAAPAKLSMPSILGSAGRPSRPMALTSRRVCRLLPSSSVTSQVALASS